jgi:AraC family transcriptional regulator
VSGDSGRGVAARRQVPETLNVSELAAAVGIHPVHLGVEFRKRFGVTTGEYVRALRIEHARPLLQKSDLSIAEIAASCGFCDQSHFARTFKAFTGSTPVEYRLRSKP